MDKYIQYWAHMLDEAFGINESLTDFKHKFKHEQDFDEYF